MKTYAITLAPGQHWLVRQAAMLTVRCHTGTLWITARDRITGPARDHVLQAGDSLQLQQPREVLIGALTPATLDITSTPAHSGRPHGTQAISSRRFFGASL